MRSASTFLVPLSTADGESLSRKRRFFTQFMKVRLALIVFRSTCRFAPSSSRFSKSRIIWWSTNKHINFDSTRRAYASFDSNLKSKANVVEAALAAKDPQRHQMYVWKKWESQRERVMQTATLFTPSNNINVSTCQVCFHREKTGLFSFATRNSKMFKMDYI